MCTKAILWSTRPVRKAEKDSLKQNMKSGEMSTLLTHEVQKKDFHWEIEINRGKY